MFGGYLPFLALKKKKKKESGEHMSLRKSVVGKNSQKLYRIKWSTQMPIL
jgi:hypothetical protein